MWYNRLSEYLLKERYKNDPICPCIYMKRFDNEFAIIVVYVGDINIVETPNELTKAIDSLKKEYEVQPNELHPFVNQISGEGLLERNVLSDHSIFLQHSPSTKYFVGSSVIQNVLTRKLPYYCILSKNRVQAHSCLVQHRAIDKLELIFRIKSC